MKKIQEWFKREINNLAYNIKLNKIPIFFILFILSIGFLSGSNNGNEIKNINNIPIIPNYKNNENINLDNKTKNVLDGIRKETPIKIKPENYNYLDNGTVIYNNINFLNGLGELKISNGTSYDTVVKLVNIYNNKSIFTVYLRNNSEYIIKNINDGDYKLYFNNGNNWNNEKGFFTINSNISVFEDLFNFKTEENAQNIKYSTYEITLNPVIGGKAKTEEINIEEFANF